MNRLVGSTVVLLVGAVLCIACTPSSHACSGALDVPSKQLQAAVDAALAGQGSTTKATDDAASTRQKYVENGLRRTFSKDIVAAAVGRSCVLLANGEGRFSVHALVYKDLATAASIRGVIEGRKANTLKLEALTYYGFIPAETTILFFVADRQSYAENLQTFEEIRRRYTAK
jgi:hypothetical protein